MTGTLFDRISVRLQAWEDRWAQRNRERLLNDRRGPGRRGGPGGRAILIWLASLIWPAIDAGRGRYGPVWLGLGSLLLFAAIFTALLLVIRRRNERMLLRYVLLVLCVGLGLALTSWFGENAYFLVILPAMATVLALPVVWPAFVGLLVVTGLAMAIAARTDAGTVIGLGVTAFTSAFAVFLMRRLFITIGLLREAREDLARAAVAEERLRFARDMHDLLGHSLSLIVVKAEVVRRLADRDPQAAAKEAGDIEVVGRQALVEVREAVTGYRQRGLSQELNGARTALTDGGVEPVVRLSAGALGTEADALLGWAVREGTTNVLRHSRAKRCAITVRRQGDTAVLTMSDDGVGGGGGAPGNGLRGLSERFSAAGGTVTADGGAGGFVLTATVPADAGGTASTPTGACTSAAAEQAASSAAAEQAAPSAATPGATALGTTSPAA